MSCPICGKPIAAGYRPFCSRRCADIDLGRWFNESYRVPAEEPDDPEASSADQPSPEPPASKPH
jgi:endogenous inhibitor of DNA gyrase (YacG/DUF329 family)